MVTASRFHGGGGGGGGGELEGLEPMLLPCYCTIQSVCCFGLGVNGKRQTGWRRWVSRVVMGMGMGMAYGYYYAGLNQRCSTRPSTRWHSGTALFMPSQTTHRLHRLTALGLAGAAHRTAWRCSVHVLQAWRP